MWARVSYVRFFLWHALQPARTTGVAAVINLHDRPTGHHPRPAGCATEPATAGQAGAGPGARSTPVIRGDSETGPKPATARAGMEKGARDMTSVQVGKHDDERGGDGAAGGGTPD